MENEDTNPSPIAQHFASRFLLRATLLVVAAGLAATLAQALTGSPQTAVGTCVVEGTVRDARGKPVADAIVTLVVQTADGTSARSLSAKTGGDGTFAFSAIGAGKFTIHATLPVSRDGAPGLRASATQALELSAGEKKHVELVLADVVSANARTAADAAAVNAMEFADQPNFTVSGMTDYSNLGLHGSSATARTSDDLTKETLALKTDGSRKNAGEPDASIATHAQPGGDAKVDAGAKHRLAGDRDEKMGDAVAAVHEYEAATLLDASEENYFAWGSELLLHHAAPAAAEVFAKGAAAHSDSARMLAGLGAALYASGLFEEAARKLCAASDLNPASPDPYLLLGKMEETAAEPSACDEEKLARFAQLQPANARANYYYALTLLKHARIAGTGDASRQIELLLRKSTELDPKLGEAYSQLGILYSSEGDFARAKESLQRAVDAKPELGQAHYQLGQLYKRSGDDARARQELAIYAQCEKSEEEARERERRELRQFQVILKDGSPAPLPQ